MNPATAKGRKRPKFMTLADCQPDGVPECFHCERKLPKRSRVEDKWDAVIVWCPYCGCMTPFPTERPRREAGTR
jgi:hypothetical protein